MNTKKHRPILTFALALTLITTLAAWTRPAHKDVPPTAVALVDILALQDQLHEWQALDANPGEPIASLHATILQNRAKYDILAAQAKDEAPLMNDLERKKLFTRAAQLENVINGDQRILDTLVQEQALATMKTIYPKINAAIAQIALQDGWDIVLLDTSRVDPIAAPDIASMNLAITQRTVLYSHPDTDITTQIAARLNNQFEAERAAP